MDKLRTCLHAGDGLVRHVRADMRTKGGVDELEAEVNYVEVGLFLALALLALVRELSQEVGVGGRWIVGEL